MNTKAKASLVGGGIGSLAAAAFMIRDGNLPGEDISPAVERIICHGRLGLARLGILGVSTGALFGAGDTVSRLNFP